MSDTSATPIAADRTDSPTPCDAGAFSTWVESFESGQLSGRGTDVPCGDCVGCCTSSMFIHVVPDDREALRDIPGPVLFPAPGLPRGHFLMGYDAKGRCPMFSRKGCRIYAARPATCRIFDCRIFAAAGIEPEEGRKAIVDRVRAWRFSYPTPRDRELHQAVRDATRFILDHRDTFPGGRIPDQPGQIALIALRARDLFLDGATEGLSRSEIAGRIVERAAGDPRHR